MSKEDKKKNIKESSRTDLESSPREMSKEESSGGSGKRRHREKNEEEDNDNGVPAVKRRKTTWPEGSQCKMLGPLHLPDLLHLPDITPTRNQEFQRLNRRLSLINRRLKAPSSSPDRQRMIEEKQAIIEEIIRKNPAFSPQSVKKKRIFKKKLYIPAKRFPRYNFFGLIIGPRGRTQKRLERETGARIQLRGRGCQRKSSRIEEEDPHVLVEAESERSLDAASAMVEKLLVPVSEGMNALKRAQLKELAELNRVQLRRLPIPFNSFFYPSHGWVSSCHRS